MLPSMCLEELPFDNALLRTLLEQVPAVVWTTDRHLRFTSNWGAELQGPHLKAGELVGKTLPEILDCDDPAEEPIARHLDALRGRCSQYEYCFQGRDFAIHLGPLRDAAGEIVGCIGAGIDITERKRDEQQMRHQARHDALTGLANYREFMETLDREVRRAERNNHGFGVLLLDFDELKRINDRFGHLAGNHALRRLAGVIREHCRAIDLPARYGGDEFGVVLVGADSGMSRNIAGRISKAARHDPEKPKLGVSVGCAVYPRDGRSAEDLVNAADRRLYRRKRNGRSASVSA